MTQQLTDGPELVFGLVGAVGSQLKPTRQHLVKALLRLVEYESAEIDVINLLDRPDLPRYAGVFEVKAKASAYAAKMNAGDDFRRTLGTNSALAYMAINRIIELRKEWNVAHGLPATKPIPKRAYILDSLKRPEEVELLRQVYGDSFHLIGAYSPREKRLAALEKAIRDTETGTEKDEPTPEQLLQRDLIDKTSPFGQDVGETFPEADLFVDASTADGSQKWIDRYIEVLFGNEFKTPTRDEFGMYHAFGARMRSADLARQVGACITTADGQVLAVGTNEVPRFGGGQYWDETGSLLPPPDDGRDFKAERDESNVMRQKLFKDTVNLLEKNGLISSAVAEQLRTPLAFEAVRDGKLMGVTEYGRSVHAEMAAISDAARRGIAISGSVLYTSTFPCHNCAKHIVACGITRVTYVHPYPKSYVASMYADSIAIDSPSTSGRVSFQSFVGVAPRRYAALFTMKQKRKSDDGKVLQWGSLGTVILRIERSPLLYGSNEQIAAGELTALMAKQQNLLKTRVEPKQLGAREEA